MLEKKEKAFAKALNRNNTEKYNTFLYYFYNTKIYNTVLYKLRLMNKTEFQLTPVEGGNFVGREALLKELVGELKNKNSRVGFCIYGRRRVGKTSVLTEVKRRLFGDRKIVVAYLSLYDLPDFSVKTFAEELVNAVLGAYEEKKIFSLGVKLNNLLNSSWEVIRELFRKSSVEVKILEYIRILFNYRDIDRNKAEYLRHAFNIGETLANATGTKCVIVLDEFPEVLKVENGMQLVKMLRTQYELQKKTVIVVSGSITKTLKAVAIEENSPFYKQLIPKHVLSFSYEETREFLRIYFGKIEEEKAMAFYELTGGLPFYLQFIGRATKFEGDFETIVKNFITQEGNLFFIEEFNKLSGKEKLIVVALSSGVNSLTEIAKKLGEPSTLVSRYLPDLTEKEVVAKVERGKYKLVDNLFGLWIKERQGH